MSDASDAPAPRETGPADRSTAPSPQDPPVQAAPSPDRSTVFVSHSSRNAEAATLIVGALEGAGVKCWVAPRDIPAGADWNHAIMTGINACRALVLIFTRHSADSDPVKREVERALNRKVPVIPIRLEHVPPSPALEYMISTSQWVDAFPPPVDRHLETVVAAVKKTLALAHAAPRADPHAPPKYVGPFRLLERLGEGGMGTVYKAEQLHPVKRTVAIKLIKPGFDSAEVIARFEIERQALARMDHPNIAKVLDAGSDGRGRPYFVMEYVPGMPITQYADENKLTVRQRLSLFTQACDAIAHAHTKALIHRDVKASNVLAYTADGKPVVKVIDFGIAKALTGDRLTDRTFNTERGQAIGTYESMSPEQADGSPDIDTRTDVYSLGVLLYELLAGGKPFEKESLAQAADAEVRRIIREVEPPRPSTRLSSLKGDAATRAAAARRAQLDALTKQLRSELEWIPLKAMRKERARRYASPQQLAEDISRYLDGKPLLAGPEKRVYRLRKFARRNRAPLAVAATVGILFFGGVTAYVRGIRVEQHRTELALSDARSQRYEADRQRQAAEAQRTAANQQKFAAHAAAREARLRLADRYARDGWGKVDAGDTSVALLWLVKSLDTIGSDPADAAETEHARIRLGTTIAAAPRLLDAPTQPGVAATDPMTSRGRRLVVDGFQVEIISISTGQPLTPPLRHKNIIISAKFSPDGRRVATASGDNTARVWDAATGEPVTPLLHHEEAVFSVAFSPNGRRVVTASDDNTARVWDAADGQPITLPLRHEVSVHFAAFSPDGLQVVTASDNTARVWDATTGEPLTPLLHHGAFIESAAVSADGRRVVTVSEDKKARVWDVAAGRPLTPPLRRGDTIDATAFRPELWRVTTPRSDGIMVSDLTTGQSVMLRLYDRVESVAFSPDRRRLATGSNDSAARVWDAATGQPITPPLHHESAVASVAFSADGRRLATGSYDKTARVWDAATGWPVTPPLRHEGRVWSAVFSADGRRVATASGEPKELGAGRVWDATTGESITPPLRHADAVNSVAFSPDGRRLATGSYDKTARVWDAATGQPLTPPFRHKDAVTSVAFNPDGRRVITAGYDKMTRAWDVAPDERPAGDLKAMAELLACQRIDATDGLTPLTADEWKSRWDDLRKRYPADFRPHADWVYEEMNRLATQPATDPSAGPAEPQAAETHPAEHATTQP